MGRKLLKGLRTTERFRLNSTSYQDDGADHHIHRVCLAPTALSWLAMVS